MTNRAILFDVDGVLIHGYNYYNHNRHCWDLNIEQDLGIPRQEFQDNFIFKSFVNDVIIGKRTLQDALDEFLPSVGYKGTTQSVVDYWVSHDSHVNLELMEHIKTLKAHMGTTLYIATHQEDNRANYLMSTLGFSEYFTDIFHSARLGLSKNDLSYFETVDSLIGPQDAPPIFFDDSPKPVETARAHGWDAYQYETLDDLKQSPYVAQLITL